MMARQRGMNGMDGIIGPIGDLLSTEGRNSKPPLRRPSAGKWSTTLSWRRPIAAKTAIASSRSTVRAASPSCRSTPSAPARGGDEDVLRGKPGVIGRAIDYVQCDRKIMPAVEYLLYNTVIVRPLTTPIRHRPHGTALSAGWSRSTAKVVRPPGGFGDRRARTQRRNARPAGRSAEIEDTGEAGRETTGRIGRVTADAAAHRAKPYNRNLPRPSTRSEEKEGGPAAATSTIWGPLPRAAKSAELEALGHTGEQIQKQRGRNWPRAARPLKARRIDAETRLGSALDGRRQPFSN